MSFGRPTLRWPLNDVTNSNSATLPVSTQTSGVQTGLADPTIFNALTGAGGLYMAYLDCGGLRNSDWLFDAIAPTPAVRLSDDQWEYPTLSGLGPHSPVSQPIYLHEGSRLEVDDAITKPDQQIRPGSVDTDPITFAASKVTWIYMDKDGVVTLDVLALASPANPPAGSFAAVGVVTDGANILTLDYASTPEFELRVTAPIIFSNAITFEGVVAFDTLSVQSLTAGNGVGVPITISNTPAGVIGLNVTGAGDAGAALIDGAGDTALTTVNTSANPTTISVNLGTGRAALLQNNDGASCTLRVEQLGASCAAQMTSAGAGTTLEAENTSTGSAGGLTNNDATRATLVLTNSTAAGPALDAKNDILLATGKKITLTGSASVTGTLSATVTAGTVDTIDETGVVKAGGVNLYTDSTPGATNGLIQWNGKRASIGSGSAAEVVQAPQFDYVATEPTNAAGTDITGLNITATVAPSEDVFITLDAHQEVDAVDGPLLRIRATNGVDSVAQLKLGDDDAAVSVLPNAAGANQRRPNSVRVLWRPTDDFPIPDNDVWTFFAQHGVPGANNLDTTAATLTLQFR